MSPDLDWQISSDTEERLIRQQARPPRWHRWGVLAAVALGVGLGLAYASIPEPPPAPTPTLPPPTIPARPALAANSLEAAVERDAFALGASAGSLEEANERAVCRDRIAMACKGRALKSSVTGQVF